MIRHNKGSSVCDSLDVDLDRASEQGDASVVDTQFFVLVPELVLLEYAAAVFFL